MNFLLGPELFAANATVALVKLMSYAADGRHRVSVPVSAEQACSDWLRRTTDDIRELVVEARRWSDMQNALSPSEFEFLVTMEASSAWTKLQLCVRDALRLAGQPFYIFVENGTSDGQFLRAMMTSPEQAWFDALTDNEYVIVHGSGGVTELTKTLAALRRSNSRQVRSAALFDSDAVEIGYQGESPTAFRKRMHPNSRAAKTACESIGPTYLHHVLQRRSIENYLPIKALGRQRQRATGKKVAALERAPWRHGYNMKAGHAGDRRRSPPPTWLPESQSSVLEDGFGDNIAELFSRTSATDYVGEGTLEEMRPFVDALRRRIE